MHPQSELILKVLSTITKQTIHNIGNLLRFFNSTYLKLTGIEIGTNTMISLRAKLDTRRGKIFIGERCHITYGCIILSHDGSARQRDSKENGEGSVIIGDGVFVGVNSVILPNVRIGDNTVIGAGSVVTNDIPANVIAAGNPARVIKTL